MLRKFEDLKGKTLTDVYIRENDTELVFVLNNGEKYMLYHSQDCCESVWLEEIIGDLRDLVGQPILLVEVATNSEEEPLERADDSYTWTFYKLATNRGYVTLRWFGTSNGYYSESVDFAAICTKCGLAITDYSCECN